MRRDPWSCARGILAGTAFSLVMACEDSVAPGGGGGALVPFAGDAQTTLPGGQMPRPLVVRALDVGGSPRAGLLVTWTASGGSSFVFDTSRTDAEGKAYAIWLSGKNSSEFTATASADSFASASFIGKTDAEALTFSAWPENVSFDALGDTITMRVRVRGVKYPLDTIIEANGASWGPDAVVKPIFTRQRGMVFQSVKNGTAWHSVNFGTNPSPFLATVRQKAVGIRVGFRGTSLAIGDTLRIGPDTSVAVSVMPVDSHGFAVVGADTQANVSWQSTNPTVAEVTADGQVIGAVDGTTTLVARYGSSEVRTIVRVWTLASSDVAAAGGSACAVLQQGGLACWGYREVGNNSQLHMSLIPEDRPGPALRSLSMSARGACGLTSSGAAYCWGTNQSGQLGTGAYQPWPAYTSQAVEVSGGITFSSIAVGEGNTTCGIATSGLGYCWGSAGEGVLGTGSYGTARCDRSSHCSMAPEKIALDATIKQITVGGGHACAITNDGRAFCWGTNRYGQLGSPSTACVGYPGAKTSGTFFCSPTPVEVDGGRKYQWISAAATHTCAVSTAGELYCWGASPNGVIGPASAGEGGIPKVTSPSPIGGDKKFTSVFSGQSVTCAIDVDSAGWCWGLASIGGLGTGSSTGPDTCLNGSCARTPTPVSGGLTFKTISPRGSAVCGQTTQNVTYCWGWGGSGALGTGTTDNRSIPTRVVFQRR